MRIFWNLIACCATAFLLGCVVPHSAERSPEFRGRILDETTRQPVARAKVALQDRASVSTKTAKDGTFRLPAKHFLQWTFHGHGKVDMREVEPYGWDLIISHRDYDTVTVDVLKHRNLEDSSRAYVAVEDLFLKPSQKQ
jgi:hypothetical protein